MAISSLEDEDRIDIMDDASARFSGGGCSMAFCSIKEMALDVRPVYRRADNIMARPMMLVLAPPTPFRVHQ